MAKEDTRFKPGQSGNPAGRPKNALSLVSLLRDELGAYIDKEDAERARVLIRAYLDKLEGDIDGVAIRDLIDRIDGRPTNRHEIEGHMEVHFDKEDEAL